MTAPTYGQPLAKADDIVARIDALLSIEPSSGVTIKWIVNQKYDTVLLEMARDEICSTRLELARMEDSAHKCVDALLGSAEICDEVVIGDDADPKDSAEWLRWAADEYASAVAKGGCYAPEPEWDVDAISPGLRAAADEIERLRARIELLELVRKAAEAWREDMTMPTDHVRSGAIGRRLINALAEIKP